MHGRWGMALFMSHGFAAWRRAWTQAMPACEEAPRRSTQSLELREATTRLPHELQTQMISALAGLVLDALNREAA